MCAFWHVITKASETRCETFCHCVSQASDSTSFQWSPDGEHILTATTTPRLREGNGYKVWHYTGKQIHQWDVAKPKDELWEASWVPSPIELFPEKPVVMPSQEEQQQQLQAAKPAIYRPPGARGKPPSTFKLHEEEPPQETVKKDEGKPQSKSALKNKKRREAKAKDREQQDSEAAIAHPSAPSVSPATNPPEDKSDNEKKLRNLKKKLKQIEQLKQQQKEGKQLETNQVRQLEG
jgi:translation initiation factor 2A